MTNFMGQINFFIMCSFLDKSATHFLIWKLVSNWIDEFEFKIYVWQQIQQFD